MCDWRLCAQRKSDEDSKDAAKRCKLTTLPAAADSAAAAAGNRSNDLTTTSEPSVAESTLQNGERSRE